MCYSIIIEGYSTGRIGFACVITEFLKGGMPNSIERQHSHSSNHIYL